MDDQQHPDMPWNPPVPGTTWQPGATVPGSVPPPPLPPVGTPRRGRGRRVVSITAATALVAAGAFAMVRVTGGGGAAGGAATPTEAVEKFVESINAEDLLGAMDVMLPGERRTFRQPMIDAVAELQRLDVLGASARLDGIDGADVEITLGELTIDEAAPDIATVHLSGHAKASVDTGRMPIGDFLVEGILGGERPTGTNTAEGDFGGVDGQSVPLTTVERDGRWYVSLWYTIAEAARRDAGAELPAVAEAIAPRGAASPEAAVGQMIEAITSFDLEAVIAGMNPDEAEALQRYAPIFLGDGQDQLDTVVSDAGARLTVADLAYDVTVDGDDATVGIEAFTINGAAEGATVKVAYDGSCTTMELDGADGDTQQSTTCDDDASSELGRSGLGFLVRATQGAGIRVSMVDGKWYVSPFGTITHSFVAVLQEMKRSDLDGLVDNVGSLAETTADDLGVAIPGIPTVDDPFGTVVLPPNPGDAGTPDTTFDTTFDTTAESGDAFDTGDAFIACYDKLDADAALACFAAGIADGSISAAQVPSTLRFPECGLAAASWTGYSQLSDVDFTAMVTAAAPCFAAKVASGELTDYEVPFEVVKPECFAGVNPYALVDPDASTAAFDAYSSCAYS